VSNQQHRCSSIGWLFLNRPQALREGSAHTMPAPVSQSVAARYKEAPKDPSRLYASTGTHNYVPNLRSV
jgi:hypothetical protein